MKLLFWLSELIKRTFGGKKGIVAQKREPIEPKASQFEIEPEELLKFTKGLRKEIRRSPQINFKPSREQNKSSLLIPKEVFQSCKLDFDNHKAFLPNWGDLDPTVSTISTGHIIRERLTYQNDEFSKKYGGLTTDLGYGLIYSIVMNAVEYENRSISSALREAIVRSNDPLLCIAVVKDYCKREAINYDKYEKIANDIIKRRESYYATNSGESSKKQIIDFASLPSFTDDEKKDLDAAKWRFNGKLIAIVPELREKPPLYLIVRISSIMGSKKIRNFNKNRRWVLNQNLVVQWDGEENYRVLDFMRGK